MKERAPELKIMDYLDHDLDTGMSVDELAMANELKNQVQHIRQLPLTVVPDTTDKQFEYWLASIPTEKRIKKNSRKIYLKYLKAIAAAACLFVLFRLALIVNPVGYISSPNSKSIDRHTLESNPHRLAYVYQMKDEELSDGRIEWLISLLVDDPSPNVRIVALDVLSNHAVSLQPHHIAALVREEVPAVQMAWLEVINKTQLENKLEVLALFSSREDLEPMVLNKITQLFDIPVN